MAVCSVLTAVVHPVGAMSLKRTRGQQRPMRTTGGELPICFRSTSSGFAAQDRILALVNSEAAYRACGCTDRRMLSPQFFRSAVSTMVSVASPLEGPCQSPPALRTLRLQFRSEVVGCAGFCIGHDQLRKLGHGCA